MKGKFEVLIDGKVQTFTEIDSIPEKIDNMISFLPEYMEGPHTKEEHEELEKHNQVLKQLMERECRQ